MVGQPHPREQTCSLANGSLHLSQAWKSPGLPTITPASGFSRIAARRSICSGLPWAHHCTATLVPTSPGAWRADNRLRLVDFQLAPVRALYEVNQGALKNPIIRIR